MRILERLAVAAIHARIVRHLVDVQGMTEAEATATVHAIGGGLGPVLQWIVTHLPELYGVAAFIAAFFGVVLPPLPPIPVPATPPAG